MPIQKIASLPTHYRNHPIQKIDDSRLRSLASPRSQCSERYRAAFRIEMGRRFVWMQGFAEALSEPERNEHL